MGGLGVPRARRKKRKALRHPVAHGILLVLCATALAPICILLLNSLRSDTAISGAPLGFPTSPVWSNYASAWDTAGYSVAFRNSLIVSASTVAGVCTFAGLAAYGLARIRVRGSGIVLVYLLIGLTLPAQLFLTPLFIAWVHLHLNNNLFGLIFIYWGIYMPFGTLLLRSFFISLSTEFEEAARVDGCNELQVFRRVVVPMAWPALVSLAVIVAVWSWNEFFFAVTFLTNPNVQTVAVRYYRFLGIYSSNLADISVGGLVVCCVPVAFFILLQRRFVQGLAAGGLKG
jgi:raffinose/stachyose/melibiose transport system permease protein